MLVRFQQFITIARTSALDIIRDPIYLILLSVSLLMIGMLPAISVFTLGASSPGGQQKFIADSSLATIWLIGLMMAAFGASTTIAQEVRRKTALAVLSKPVERWIFVLAKYCGLCAALAVLTFAGMIATLAATRMSIDGHRLVVDPAVAIWYVGTVAVGFLAAAFSNYFLHRQFQQDAVWITVLLLTLGFIPVGIFGFFSPDQAKATTVNWQLVPATVLIYLALLVMSSLTIAFSTRLEAIPTLILGFGIFLVGLTSDYAFGRHAADHIAWAVLYGALPNWQHFWMADALSNQKQIPWSYVLVTARYAFFYLSAFLALGVWLFQEKELG